MNLIDWQRRFFFFLCLLLIACAFPNNVTAQATTDPRWRHYKQEDGLASNDIWSILGDQDGMWFGGSNSLSHFNGTWNTYDSRVPNSSAILSTPNIQTNAQIDVVSTNPIDIRGEVSALAHSSDQQLIWIGTRQGQISLLDPKTRQWHQFAQVDDEVTDLLADGDRLWVATLGQFYQMQVTQGADTPFPQIGTMELVEIDAPIYEFLLYKNELYVAHKEGVQRYDGTVWSAITVPSIAAFGNPIAPWCTSTESGLDNVNSDSAPSINPAIHALWIDAEEAFWIGTADGAARRTVDQVTGEYCWIIFPTYTPEGNLALVQSLTGDEEGSIWAATDGGGALLFDEFGAFTLPFGRNVPGNLNTNFVRDVAIDQDGSAWFATPIGVFQFLDHTWYLEPSYADTFGLSIAEPYIHNIRDLLVDQNEQLWIATGAGIRVKESPTIERTRYNIESSNLPSNNVLTLTEDRDGNIWAGTDGAGVARFINGQWSNPIPLDRLPSSAVTNLAADEKGLVWIGTDGGLLSYQIDTRETQWVDELIGETIKSLVIDLTGRLWIASSRSNGIGAPQATIWHYTLGDEGNNLQGQDLGEITAVSSLPYEFELNLAADYGIPGGIWLAVDQVGLFHWDGTTWQDGDPDRQLPTDFLWTLYTEPGSTALWIGNEGGVTRFDGRTWGTLKDEDGLRSPATWAIASTAEGGYWFGGLTGLSYYRPDVTPPWIRLGQILGEQSSLDAMGGISTVEGDTLSLLLDYGDLQTPREKIKLYYRHVQSIETDQDDSAWIELVGPYQLETESPADERIEFRARDQSFNYSAIYSVPLVVAAANVIDLRLIGLGEVERTTFLTLIALSILAILGFGYVSMEIVQGRRRAMEAIARSYNPYVSGEPIRRDDMFFGRHNLLQRISDTLHNNSIMLHGERRIGKTTMLYQIANRLEDFEDADYWFLPVFVDLEGTPQELFFHFLIEEIVHRVLTINGGELADQMVLDDLLFYETADVDYTDREFSRDLRRVVRQLQAYGEEHRPKQQLRLILMMDEMDVMSSYDHLVQQQLRRIFMRDFAATIGAVVAGIQISKDWERIESPWFNMFNEIMIEPFTREQAVELLVEPVKEYYMYDQDALNFIIEQSDGRPFRIQQYGLEVVTSMLAAGRRRITLEDVMVAHKNIQNSYAKAHGDDGLLQPLPPMSESMGDTTAYTVAEVAVVAVADAGTAVVAQPTQVGSPEDSEFPVAAAENETNTP